MKKRRLLAIFAATAIMAGTMLAVGCSKNSEPTASETYTGTVSTAAYVDENAAASACIENEINGSDYQVTYDRYEKEATLTNAEVDKLNVKTEVNGTIDSVEKGKIYFNEVSSVTAQAAAAAQTDAVDMYITVYIIKYTPQGATISQYKYVVPLPANGEVLSYSYYNSVMNPDNYKNCTMTATVSEIVTVEGEQTTNVNSSVTMQITETAAKFDVSVPMEGTGTVNATVYMADTSTGLKCAMEMTYNGYKMCMPIDSTDIGYNVDSVSELYSTSLSEAQYSLFVKTDTGFKMRDKGMEALMDSTFDAVFQELGVSGINIDWTTRKASADYRVVNGKLSKSIVEFDADASISLYNQTSTFTMKYSADISYTNYGTTTVSLSQDAKNALGITE